jgi:hypothetical protein
LRQVFCLLNVLLDLLPVAFSPFRFQCGPRTQRFE